MILTIESDPIKRLRANIISNADCDGDLSKLLSAVISKAAVDHYNGDKSVEEYFSNEMFDEDCEMLGVSKTWLLKTVECLTNRDNVVRYYKAVKAMRNG